MSYDALLIQEVNVHRRAATTYVDGTPIRGDYTPVATYPGRLGRAGGGEQITLNSDQRESVRTGLVFLPVTAEIQVSDMLEIDGWLYEVTFARKPLGFSAPHHTEVNVRLVTAT